MTVIDAATISESLGGKRSGKGWRAPCPVREHNSDKRPLAITDGDYGTPLVYCHAGCDFIDISRELRSRGLWPEMSHEQANTYRHKRKTRISQAQIQYSRTFVAIVAADAEAGRYISPESKRILKKCCKVLREAAHAANR